MNSMEERRRFPRYSVYCPIEYKGDEERPRAYSVTLNISEIGALIAAKSFINISAHLLLRMVFKGEEFFIRSRAVRIEKGSEDDSYNVGVEFLEKPFFFVRKLYEELESIMIYQRQYSKEMGVDMSLAEASVKWYSNTRMWM